MKENETYKPRPVVPIGSAAALSEAECQYSRRHQRNQGKGRDLQAMARC